MGMPSIAAAFLILTMGSGAAVANTAGPRNPFDQPVTEYALADSNAVIAAYFRANSDGIDADERSFTRQVGSITQVTFDNWFADIGMPMIAANIRADRLGG